MNLKMNAGQQRQYHMLNTMEFIIIKSCKDYAQINGIQETESATVRSLAEVGNMLLPLTECKP